MGRTAGRPGVDAGERAQAWERWRAGWSMERIARALVRDRHTVAAIIGRHGGYAPVPRRRAAEQLTTQDREEISRGISSGLSARGIAPRIGKHHSTVSREIQRNGGRLAYRATLAEAAAWERAQRPKPCLLSQRPRLCRCGARAATLLVTATDRDST